MQCKIWNLRGCESLRKKLPRLYSALFTGLFTPPNFLLKFKFPNFLSYIILQLIHEFPALNHSTIMTRKHLASQHEQVPLKDSNSFQMAQIVTDFMCMRKVKNLTLREISSFLTGFEDILNFISFTWSDFNKKIKINFFSFEKKSLWHH